MLSTGLLPHGRPQVSRAAACSCWQTGRHLRVTASLQSPGSVCGVGCTVCRQPGHVLYRPAAVSCASHTGGCRGWCARSHLSQRSTQTTANGSPFKRAFSVTRERKYTSDMDTAGFIASTTTGRVAAHVVLFLARRVTYTCLCVCAVFAFIDRYNSVYRTTNTNLKPLLATGNYV